MTIQELYERIGGSYEQAVRVMRMDKLIDRYVCRFEESGLMEKLHAAGERMDAAGIFDSAHALKGVCGNLGFDSLAAEASELTEEFRPGAARRYTDAEVREKLQTIEAHYRRTTEGIHAYKREKQ